MPELKGMPELKKMPELTEVDKATASMTEKRKEETASSDSDSDDTIPELEDAGNLIPHNFMFLSATLWSNLKVRNDM